MTIKDFEVGQTAYILHMFTGRNHKPVIIETAVEKIGRKYVTVQHGKKYEEDSSDNPYGLIETSDWGDRTFLCPSRTDAEMYVERHQLRIWLYSIGGYGRAQYTLEQLRQVKTILEPEEENDGEIN